MKARTEAFNVDTHIIAEADRLQHGQKFGGVAVTEGTLTIFNEIKATLACDIVVFTLTRHFLYHTHK